MSLTRVLGVFFIGIGALSIVYHQVAVPKDLRGIHRVKITSRQIDQQEATDLSMWGGLATLLVGSGMVLVRPRRT